MVVDTGNKFWAYDGNFWNVKDSFTREYGFVFEVPRKKDKNGKIIQYSTKDWFQQPAGKPGSSSWNPDGDGFKGNKAKAWTKGIVGVLTGNEKITDAAIHGSTDDFLKSTGEGMSDTELAINLTVLGAGVVGGIASSRAGVRSGHMESGNLKALRTKYKINKQQLKEQAAKDKLDISKVSEARIDSFIEEWNKRDPADNVKIADSVLEKSYQKANKKYSDHLANKPKWDGGSWDRADPGKKATFTRTWNLWKATKRNLNRQVEEIGNKFSKVREAYNKIKAERDRIKKENEGKAAEESVRKFERDNDLEPLSFMEYLQNFKKIYNKNPTETELANFKITFNKFRVDLKNVDSAVREKALENYKAAGESDPTATYFRMWEDIKSKNNGKINLKTFEQQIETESLAARNSKRASRIKEFENQHGLKNMSIEEYIYEYQAQNNGYRPTRQQLKDFIAEYNDYRIDLNSIAEETKIKIMEDYEAGGEKTPDLFEVWKVNKSKGGDVKAFEQELLSDAAKSRRAADYTKQLNKLGDLDKNKDGQLTKEEVEAFNKKFDFDADGILGETEKAAKTKEIEEKYPDLDAEERRLMEDDEVEVDLFGLGERAAKSGKGGKGGKGGKSKAKKGAAAGVGAGVIAGAVASAVSGKKNEGDIDDKRFPDTMPSTRRRMIEYNIYDALKQYFNADYNYPSKNNNNNLFFQSDPVKYYTQKNPFIQDIPPNNPFDTTTQQEIYNINEHPYHPDIKKNKVHELLLDSLHSYNEKVDHNSILISNNDYIYIDTQVKVFTKNMYKVVSFRGTEMNNAGMPNSLGDVFTDANTVSARLSNYFPFIKPANDLIGHMGFIQSVAAVYDQLKEQLEGVEYFECTGHSLGAALSTIFAYVYSLDTNKFPVHLFVFGSPRVFIGNDSAEKYNKRMDLVRFQNSNDGATFVPSQEISLQGLGTANMGAGLGAMSGQILESRLGKFSQPNFGMFKTLGAIAGLYAGSQVSPLPYIHVGLGIMLFRNKNEIVNIEPSLSQHYLGGNEGMRIVQENYIFIPEGQDILRNPVNIEGLVVKGVEDMFQFSLVNKYLLGSGSLNDPTFKLVFDSYLKDNNFGNSFIQKAYSYYRVWLDSQSILGDNKLTHTILDRIKLYRQRVVRQQSKKDPLLELEMDFAPVPFASLTGENLKKLGEDIFLLNQQFLNKPEVDRLEYYNEKTSILTAYPFGRNNPEFAKYLDDVNRLITRYFKEQKSEDFFHLRDCFTRFHLYWVYTSTTLASRLIEGYNHFDGHLISTYLSRIDELPETIYNGENVPEIITDTSIGGGQGNENYNTYRRNINLPNSRNYYDKNGVGHYINNFNKIKRVDDILGFVFYKDDKILNKLILY